MPELNFTPFPQIETERLLLRRLMDQDSPEIFFFRSDELVLKYIGREPAKNLQEASDFIKKINENIDANDSILWGIALKNDPVKLIGTICFWNIQKENQRSEIGFLLHPDHWQKGIMKEAIFKVLEFGFGTMGLHSVEGRIHPDNIASASVLESTGFIKEGHLKEDFYFRGEFLDTVIYSRLQK